MAKLMLVGLVLLIGACQTSLVSTPTMEPGQWLTISLEREGEILTFEGPDLSEMARENRVFTYYERGEWVALVWEGYREGKNTWRIPQDVMEERPDWETNQAWSLDFWWPDRLGAPPAGAHPGTSSR